jgi:hypothetical protein
MNAGDKIDGYAIRNTKDVICALSAYQRVALKGTKAEARKAAIDRYESLSGVRVGARTVCNWLEVVKSYDALNKVPENAFGARKATPHIARPFRDKVRQIIKEAHRIERFAQDCDGGASSPDAEEAAAIARLLEGTVSRANDDYFKAPMISVRGLAEHLGRTSIHHVFRYLAEADLDGALTDVLLRLRALRQAREKLPLRGIKAAGLINA